MISCLVALVMIFSMVGLAKILCTVKVAMIFYMAAMIMIN